MGRLRKIEIPERILGRGYENALRPANLSLSSGAHREFLFSLPGNPFFSDNSLSLDIFLGVISYNLPHRIRLLKIKARERSGFQATLLSTPPQTFLGKKALFFLTEIKKMKLASRNKYLKNSCCNTYCKPNWDHIKHPVVSS